MATRKTSGASTKRVVSSGGGRAAVKPISSGGGRKVTTISKPVSNGGGRKVTTTKGTAIAKKTGIAGTKPKAPASAKGSSVAASGMKSLSKNKNRYY